MVELSVVMISKNQENNIRRLIESVFANTKEIASTEIILVDSNSTDRTTEIACEYPIHVLRLKPGQRFSAAAGRYTGYQHSSGDLVLFLDGDHELLPDWLPQAIDVIQSDPKIGAVAGPVIDVPRDQPETKPDVADVWNQSSGFQKVIHGGPAALYRRDVLEQVGCFNPYIYSDEEPELCVRIRHAGYDVMLTDRPAVYHYTYVDTIKALVGRWKRNLYYGPGQALRYHFGTDLFWPYVHDRGHGLIIAPVFIALVAVLWWFVIVHDPIPLELWIVLNVLVIVAYTIRNHSFHRTIYSLTKRTLLFFGIVTGFMLAPESPNNYPADVDVLR